MVFGTTCLFLVISLLVHSWKRPPHEFLLYPWLLLVFEISLIKGPGIKAAETSKTANQGGSIILNCELKIQGDKSPQTIIQWRKSGLKQPVFVKYSNYPANAHEDFTDRVELVNGDASLRISRIQEKDEGWYECSVEVIDDGVDESKKNGTWVYLNVNSKLGKTNKNNLISVSENLHV